MIDSLDPIIREAILKMLGAVYESGLLDQVDIRHVVRMFGGDPDSVSTNDADWIIDLTSEEFLQAYCDIKDEEIQRIVDATQIVPDLSDEDEFKDVAYGEYLYDKKRTLH